MTRFISLSCSLVLMALAPAVALAAGPAPVGGTPMKTDFNGDGRSDILWKNTVTGEAAIWLMNGTTPTPMIVSGQPTSSSPVDAVDTGGLGFADILWRTPDANYYLSKLNGAQVVATLPILVQPDPYNLWEYAGRADFDGDGKQDILWRHVDGRYRITLLDSTTVKSNTDFSPPVFGAFVALMGDLNGDGKTDLVWRNVVDNRVSVSIMDGATLVSTTEIFPPGYTWVPMWMGDFNADGKADLAWQTVEITQQRFITTWTITNGRWLMNGATRLAASTTPATAGIIGDYNHDGKADFAWYDSSRGICVQAEDGLAVAQETCTTVPDTATPILTGDFDGDGNSDVLWGQNGLYGIALLNPFLKEYRKLLTPGHSWRPLGLAPGLSPLPSNQPPVNSVRSKTDLNGDGYPDLLFTQPSGAAMRVLMQGGTYLARETITGAPAGAQLVQAVDTVGNGVSDLVWRTPDGRYHLTVMNGPQVASTSVLEPQVDPLGPWTLVARGEFNGDGRQDLLWQRLDGKYRITLLSNHAITQSGELVAPSIDARIGQIGDLDGDGRSDLVWTGLFTGYVWVSLVNATTIDTNLIWVGGQSQAVVEVADYNGDGKADLGWSGPSGTRELWLMNGKTPTTIAAGFRPLGALVGDFDGNRRPDTITHYDGVGTIPGSNTTLSFGQQDPYAQAQQVDLTAYDYYQPVALFDFNLDGRSDILFGGSTYTVVLMNGAQVLSSNVILDYQQFGYWYYLDIR